MGAAQPLHLIGCAAMKLPHAAPARDLYVSDLFRKAVAYAEARGAPWVILSALHGVVDPSRFLTPYNRTLTMMLREERKAWGAMVARQLGDLAAHDVVFLAGANYRLPIVESPLWLERRYRATAPMEGLGIGEQKAWLLRNTPMVAA